VKTESWPFDDPATLAVFSVREIVFGGKPILFVSHDDDGGWQFLTGETARKEDAVIVGLKEIVELDSSVATLADLPTGWIATRRSPNAAWEREIHP
jgi:hypothetical protein